MRALGRDTSVWRKGVTDEARAVAATPGVESNKPAVNMKSVGGALVPQAVANAQNISCASATA
jgi:hypothetical protein